MDRVHQIYFRKWEIPLQTFDFKHIEEFLKMFIISLYLASDLNKLLLIIVLDLASLDTNKTDESENHFLYSVLFI